MKKGFGRGVCCGEKFSLLYSRVCCIIGLEKNISGFLLSLSLSSHGGKLFERNLLFIKQLGTNLGFFFKKNLRKGSQKVFKHTKML